MQGNDTPFELTGVAPDFLAADDSDRSVDLHVSACMCTCAYAAGMHGMQPSGWSGNRSEDTKHQAPSTKHHIYKRSPA